MLKNELWSPAVENVIAALSPVRNAVQQFPKIGVQNHRHPDGVPPMNALRDLITSLSLADLDLMLLTDNILFIGSVTYNNEQPPQATAFSFQAYAAIEFGIHEIQLATVETTVDYLRFECHPQKPGRILSEPTTHLHINANGTPRTSIQAGPAGNPLLWFLEFLTIRYDYETWFRWIEVIAEINHIENFARLSESFRSGDIHQSNAIFYPDLQQLIAAITRAKKESVQKMDFSHPFGSEINYQLG